MRPTQRRPRTGRLVIAVLVVLATAVPMTSAAALTENVTIPFEKSVTSGPNPVVWKGTAGVAGTIVTQLAQNDIRQTGKVWHVAFESWQVANTGTECASFEADLAGIVNLKNGRVSLNGTVTDGDCEGSRIHVRAILDLSDYSSQGTMRITS